MQFLEVNEPQVNLNVSAFFCMPFETDGLGNQEHCPTFLQES